MCDNCELLFKGKRQGERKHIFCGNACYYAYRTKYRDDPDRGIGYEFKARRTDHSLPAQEEYGVDLLAHFRKMRESHG